MLAGRPFVLKHPLRSEGLTVIDASSPEFMPAVGKFVDADLIVKSSSFLPYSLVIINNTGRYIWGFTIIYSYPDKIAPAGKPWRNVITPSSRVTDRKRMLEPGASMLITPIADFIGSLDARGNPKLRVWWDEGLDRILKVWADDSNGRIEAAVDSVIYEDGTLAGPDTADKMGELNARIRADSDLFASVSGLRGDELRKALSLYKAAPPILHDDYSSQLIATAAYFLELFDHNEETLVVAALKEHRTKRWFGESKFVRRTQ